MSGIWKLHRDPGSDAIRAARDGDCGAVQLCDLIDDGEPQPAAVPGRIRQAIKSLAHPLPVRLGYAGAGVFHGEEWLAVHPTGTDGDAAVAGSVLERIVDQITQQIIEQRGIGLEGDRLRLDS